MPGWTRTHNPSTPRDGHRICRGDDGRISMLDYSGSTPDTADDGPLIVVPGTIVTVEHSQYGISYSVPVKCERDDRDGRVCINTETMRALARLDELKLRCDYSESFKKLRDEVFFACLLSPAYD